MGTVKVMLPRSRKLKHGRYPIAIRLPHLKKLKYIITGIQHKKGNGKYPLYLISKNPNHKELDTFLQKEYTRANDELIKLNDTEKPFTVWDINARIKKNTISTTLFTFAEDLISKLAESGRIGNAENYKLIKE